MTEQPLPRIWATREEAADYLRTSPATIDRYVREGKLPKHRRAGKDSILFRVTDLDALITLVDNEEAKGA